MSVVRELFVQTDLQALQRIVAESPIVLGEQRPARLPQDFERPIANWATIRRSGEVDAFVLSWLASHARRGPEQAA